MDRTYDFIVVGGGASGCVVAARLARSATKPSVLLLEAGGTNDGVDHMSGAERFDVAFKPGSKLNWGYKTTPQFGRKTDYSRGKGLGGSTAINFCGWVVGADEDYNEWGRLVDHDSFAWPHVKDCLKRIERLHPEVPAGFDHHIHPHIEEHGVDGVIDVAYGNEWLQSTKDVFKAAEQSGMPLNADVNSGNPIGMGISTACIYQGRRITASSAYLHGCPNLTVRTDSLVRRVLFEGNVAIGVETMDNQKFTATREIVLSGGAINTPQLLLLSGIGPPEELREHGVNIVYDLPHVGRNLQDHCFSSAGIVLKKGNGHLAEKKQSPSPMGWFKLKTLDRSPELENLPEDMRKYLAKSTVPHWELATNTPFFDGESVQPDEEVFSAICLVMNPQSRGKISLVSSDPLVAPQIDPAFLSHPFDKKIITEAMREMLRYFSAPVFRERTVRGLGWPKVDTDEAILNQCKAHLQSSWHACGTARMGRDEKDACVDSNFKVFGFSNLRVADMSVCPLIPNNHTQTTAYVIGEIAAEKLIAEYRLDRMGTL
ncbi:GMC oxidoreductase [Zasmidium cellare ATCC 36951]|uniref:GMC oxidoreductase n=1 Tax=Zasmidium cellare ATCC 36951 TaxID=1080233 RepID=A0A6A6CMK7_ZASCE|nr:GMC oxidoreductase [Zasmidium cellare ATCC 36951]KAF2166676.1 GMC oxidoreductase [Zasmidium cellare ATCC 36951]